MRGYTIVKWIWSTIYYSVSASTAYLILQPSSFMPTWMGGNGTCLNLFQYIHSFNEASTAMRVYYLVQFGKHLSRFFTHALIRSEGNFYEFVLHHALSTILIVFSYLSNMWIIGIFILGLHDASDCTLILARIYRVLGGRLRNIVLATLSSCISCMCWQLSTGSPVAMVSSLTVACTLP